jgi:hypothetical protein
MVPFGNNSQFLCLYFRVPRGPGLPITASPVKPSGIGCGTRPLAEPLAELFCAKQHGRPGARQQKLSRAARRLRGRHTDAFGREF